MNIKDLEIHGDGFYKVEDVEKLISDSKPPMVTTQMLIDSGINAFGLQLLIESLVDKKDVKTFKPLRFEYRGIIITLEPVPE